MNIEFSEEEMEDLKACYDIFHNSYSHDEKMVCFDIICEMIENDKDFDELGVEDKELVLRQLKEAADFLAFFYCISQAVNKLIQYFDQ